MADKSENMVVKPADGEMTLGELGEFIEKIETSKQQTALKQIEVTDKDNERQFTFAMEREKNDFKKWSLAFWIGVAASAVLGLSGLVLIFKGQTDIGLGLLGTTLSGVFGYIAGAGSCNKK